MAASMSRTRSTCNFDEMESLKEVSYQFFEMVPVRKMKWKDEEAAMLASSTELQRRILLATVQHPLCKKFTPALSYMRYFMKLLIQKLESEDAEICDEIYEAYTDLLSQQEDEEDTLCYKSYTMPSGERISLQESVNLVSQGTTGLSTWQAAQHLSEWIIENPQIFSNRSVIELGSGQGLPGLVACKFCQFQSYTFSDCHAQVLYLLSRNIELNLVMASHCAGTDNSHHDKRNLQKIRRQLSLTSDQSVIDSGGGEVTEIETSISSVDKGEGLSDENEDEIYSDDIELEVDTNYWSKDSAHHCATLQEDSRIHLCHLNWECVKIRFLDWLKADIILAADVVYDASIVPALVFVLKSLLFTKPRSNRQPQAYIASTIRNEDTRDAFLIAMGAEGLNYSIVDPPKQQLFHYDRSVPIEILHITAH